MDILRQNKVAILVGLLLLGGAFYYVSSNNNSAAPLTTTQAGGSGGPATAELLASLSNLHTIELDGSVFTGPVFLSLTDFGVIIPPQDVGRRNPFAPIGSTARVVGTSTKAR